MAAIGSGYALYDVETGQTLIKKENAHHSKINHMCFTCGGLYLATAAVDGSIRLWSFVDILKDIIQNNNTSGKSLVNTATTKDMLSVWWSIDNHRNTVSLVGECLAHSGAVQMLAECDGESLVSCGEDGLLIVWKRYIMAAIGSGYALYDVETGQTLIKKENAHHSKINHMCFTCGGLYLATAAVDGSIRLWSFVDILKDIIQNNNTSGKSLVNTATTKDMLSVWWSIDNHRNTVSLVGECLAHSGAVQMLAECDGESLVSCGEDGLLIVWKNENIQMMKRSHILQTFLMCDGIV